MYKRNLFFAVLAFAVISGCVRKEEEIRIGAILSLTGTAAQWGTPPRDAALMAVDELNTRGGIKGRQIKLEIEDDQCEPAKGTLALQKMLTTGKPIAILGAICSSVSLAIAPLVEQNRVVMISPASTNPLLTDAGDYVFRVIPTDALRGKVFAEYVYSIGIRKVCMVYINNEGGAGNQKTFAENFKKLGGAILSVEAYAQESRDMRAQLTKAKKEKPDALVIVSYPDDTPLVLRQAQELRVNVPLFFQTEALEDPSVIQKAGNAAEGATYILPAKARGASVDSFSSRYKQRYARDPELYAAEGYDVIMLIAKILEESESISSEAIKAGLYRIKWYEAASGSITFDENGDVIKPMAVKKIIAGRPEVVLER
jgi:branched-chain amino acid transport system substrate-binding protein